MDDLKEMMQTVSETMQPIFEQQSRQRRISDVSTIVAALITSKCSYPAVQVSIVTGEVTGVENIVATAAIIYAEIERITK